MRKPAHISINNEPIIFFDNESRLLITPEVFTFLEDSVDEMKFDMTHELWLDQVWDCLDDVVRVLGWRGISTKPIHISRCLAEMKDTDESDFHDARRVLYRDEPTDPTLPARKEEQLLYESSRFVNKKDEFINDEQWCTYVADLFSRLLATLAINKIGMNVFAFLELLADANKATMHPNNRRLYLALVGFELYSRASIAVLRGEEIW